MSEKPTRRQLEVALENAGAAMANYLVVLSKRPGFAMFQSDVDMFDGMRREWDLSLGRVRQAAHLTGEAAPGALQGPSLTEAERQTLLGLLTCALVLDKRPRPACRDCADEAGRCPSTGLACDMRKLFVDSRAVIERLTASPPPPESEELAKLLEEAARYRELIRATKRKNPTETRHETALRYITQAQLFVSETAIVELYPEDEND